MRTVQEVIVVEGRYDKHRVTQAVNATIITTSGFSILNNKEKVSLLRRLAEKRGLIILTDTDRAGFFIRNRLKSMLSDTNIKHAYIPDVKGTEKRKEKPSKEGKLGVEAMPDNVIQKALERAGATFVDTGTEPVIKGNITKADLFELGLTGNINSAIKRRELNKSLNFPERLSTNNLLEALNILYTRDEFINFLNNTIYKM
jgi:ribonuclease M5